MVIIYTSPGCASCRKVKQYLKDRNIKYVEKNIFKVLLDREEIKLLLLRSDNGSDDIISKRSKIIQENQVDIDSMTTNELIDFIIKNPSVLKRPIIINERHMQIGYDKEEIDTFIPPELRNTDFSNFCNNDCSHFDTCGGLREE